MAVAYDAVSTTTGGTGNLNWTHTPVGTPRGVLVLIIQNGTLADQVTGVTYGGVAMTQVPGSPLIETVASTGTGGDAPLLGAVHGFFLGSGIPTGARSVAVTVSGGDVKRAVCSTVTAAADTVVDDTATLDIDNIGGINHVEVTLDTTTETVCYGADHANVGNTGSVTTEAPFTQLFETDFGNWVGNFQRRTANGTAGPVVVSWEQNTGSASGILAVAVAEAAAGSSVDLTAAVVELEAVPLSPTPGSVAVALTPAEVSLAAAPVAPAPGPVTVNLTPAEASLAAVAMSPSPGAVTVDLTPAVVSLTAAALMEALAVDITVTVGPTRVIERATVGATTLSASAGSTRLSWAAADTRTGWQTGPTRIDRED